MGKGQDIPHPPPGPPGPPPYDQAQANMAFYPPPPMGWGVSATCQPNPHIVKTEDGFNVWGITGYSGFIRMPQDNDALKTLAQLETMKQVMGRNHSFDLGQIPFPPPPPPAPAADLPDPDVPAPPPPEPAAQAEPEPEPEPAAKKVRKFETITIHPPPHVPADLENELVCYRPECQTSQPVKKIKSLGGKPVCWFHVVQELENDASKAWQES